MDQGEQERGGVQIYRDKSSKKVSFSATVGAGGVELIAIPLYFTSSLLLCNTIGDGEVASHPPSSVSIA